MNKAVFMDRDGTIARDVPYCSRPEDFELLPGAAEGIKFLNEHGFKVVVVTNQSGIARHYFTEKMLARIHDKMRNELAKHGAYIDAIYYCSHHPDDNCECRKPKPKMVFQAALELNIDLGQSYVVGDSSIDIEMGRRAGCKSILIAATIGDRDEGAIHYSLKPDYIVPSSIAAARFIIAEAKVTSRDTESLEYEDCPSHTNIFCVW